MTVDPSGSADETSIEDAIDSITGSGSVTEKWTILIYAGEYNENVTLDGNDENIDLVGIDRDSVIIKPTSGNGIVITSGTETARNNRISNLTIETTGGTGIQITKGGTPAPTNIEINNVTIKADGPLPVGNAIGITGVEAENVNVTNSSITSDDGDAIHVGDNWTLTQVIAQTTEDSTFNQDALVVGDHKDLIVNSCSIIGEKRAIFLDEAEDVLVQDSTLTTTGSGGAQEATVWMTGDTKRVLYKSCVIVSDATLTSELRSTPKAVFVDTGQPIDDIAFESCRITVIGDSDGTGGTTNVTALQSDIGGTITLVDCDITADNRNTGSQSEAYGVYNGDFQIFGGVITTMTASSTSDPATDTETDVWDLLKGSTRDVAVSGTRFSKWKGVIDSAERPRSVTQRTINVDAASETAIIDFTLTGDVEYNETGADPDVYRVLSVKGNEGDMVGPAMKVYIIGTNWGDDVIVEKFQLLGTTLVEGKKPFKTVSKIIFPAKNDDDEKVSVGVTERLGLYVPISAKSAVLQQARKASAATSYMIETLDADNVDATYATIEVDDDITEGDSFEWAILTVQ